MDPEAEDIENSKFKAVSLPRSNSKASLAMQSNQIYLNFDDLFLASLNWLNKDGYV